MLLVSSCSCIYPIRWSQVLSWELRCSWSSADRRCSNYIWVINNFIAYLSASYIRDLTVFMWFLWDIFITLFVFGRYYPLWLHMYILKTVDNKCIISIGNAVLFQIRLCYCIFPECFCFYSSLPGQMADISPTVFSAAFFVNEDFCILIKTSLKFLPRRPINPNSAFV